MRQRNARHIGLLTWLAEYIDRLSFKLDQRLVWAFHLLEVLVKLLPILPQKPANISVSLPPFWSALQKHQVGIRLEALLLHFTCTIALTERPRACQTQRFLANDQVQLLERARACKEYYRRRVFGCP
jgi:hypothetical protein